MKQREARKRLQYARPYRKRPRLEISAKIKSMFRELRAQEREVEQVARRTALPPT